MARYTATDARRLFFQLLDAVERGEQVVLERKGVRFRLVLERSTPQETPAPPFEIMDRVVREGTWTWAADEEGRLRFQAEGEDR